MKDLILKPRVSEKAYGLSKVRNTYVFDVPLNANKYMVAQAVAAQFDVTVVSVNMTNVKGKMKRTVRRGGRPTMGQRNDSKRAYVTLKADDQLPVFAALEEPTEKPAAKKGKK